MGDISAGLTDMWRSVLLFLPKAALFLAILAVGWILARAARKLADRALQRVGFDRAVRRGGIGRALARGNYDASDIVVRLAYYGLLLLTLQVAFGVWGPNPVSDLISAVVSWLPRVFVSIIIVVVAAAIASAVKDLISGALGGLSYGRVLADVASWFIIGLGVIAALNQIGIATTVTTPLLIAALATIAGILIVGVGGGLVRPMAQRWDRWLDRVELEARIVRDRARSYSAGRGDLGREMGDGHGDLGREMGDGHEPGGHAAGERRAAGGGDGTITGDGAGQDRTAFDQDVTRPVSGTGRPASDTDATQPVSDSELTQPLPPVDRTQPLPRLGDGTPPVAPAEAPSSAPPAPGRKRQPKDADDAGLGLITGDGGTETGRPSYRPDPDGEARYGVRPSGGTVNEVSSIDETQRIDPVVR